MDAEVWWLEFVSMAEELTSACDVEVVAVGVSGMGPCVLVTDRNGKPLRPAILYGVDTRATSQIDQLNDELGADQILDRCGSALSSQAVGPKLLWLGQQEPEVFSRARMLFMPASWLAYRLTGQYLS
jgi:xylulokinase